MRAASSSQSMYLRRGYKLAIPNYYGVCARVSSTPTLLPGCPPNPERQPPDLEEEEEEEDEEEEEFYRVLGGVSTHGLLLPVISESDSLVSSLGASVVSGPAPPSVLTVNECGLYCFSVNGARLRNSPPPPASCGSAGSAKRGGFLLNFTGYYVP